VPQQTQVCFFVKFQFTETQILQAQRNNICKLNYPMCEAKWDYLMVLILQKQSA